MQLKTKVDEVINLTSVHGAMKEQFDRRVAELEDKCARMTQANKQLEIRRYVSRAVGLTRSIVINVSSVVVF
jgi:hypothetical protein